MRFVFGIFWRTKRLASVAVALAALSGLASTVLIFSINHALVSEHGGKSGAFLAYGLIALGYLLITSAGNYLVNCVALKNASILRLDLCRRVLQTPLRKLELIGGDRVLAALTEHIAGIVQAVAQLPLMIANGIVIIWCVAYLFWVSWMLGVCFFLFMITTVHLFQVFFVEPGLKRLREAHAQQNQVFGHLKQMNDGVADLVLHRETASHFFESFITREEQHLHRLRLKAANYFSVGGAFNQASLFILLGLVLFCFSDLLALDPRETMVCAFTILFLFTPTAAVVAALPVFSRAGVVAEELEKLGLLLGESDLQISRTPRTPCAISVLEWRNARYFYRDAKGAAGFELGPMSLTFRPGELVFLSGANGSGKTTFAKLLVGMYTPDSGSIALNGEEINESNRDWYRDHFAVVWSTSHLFRNILGVSAVDLDERANEYLVRLGLKKIVKVRDGAFSTVDLSQGQRKRLALVAALLEDRPFYLFDEWTADQDPEFREYFYHCILPDLRRRGKAVLAITHDDRYFGAADRLIKLEYGRLTSFEPGLASPVGKEGLVGHPAGE